MLIERKWLQMGPLGAILAILAALLCALAYDVYHTYQYSTTRDQMQAVARALINYHTRHHTFPDDLRLSDPEFAALPKGNVNYGFTVEFSENSFTLLSLARDGKKGGDHFDQDIVVTWILGYESMRITTAPIIFPDIPGW